MPLNRQQGEILEVACHEDNQDLQHLKDIRDEARAKAGRAGQNSQEPGENSVLTKVRFHVAVIAMAALATTASAIAHHSFAAEFDENRPVKFTARSPRCGGRTHTAGSMWMSRALTARS
jgi:hypothetical protein